MHWSMWPPKIVRARISAKDYYQVISKHHTCKQCVKQNGQYSLDLFKKWCKYPELDWKDLLRHLLAGYHEN